MNEKAVSVAYLDSNVFIEAMEGPDGASLPIKRLIEGTLAQRGVLITSELTLAEVLAPIRRRALPPPLRQLYLDLMADDGRVELKPVTREVLFRTIDLRESLRLKLPDAIHLATAVLAGCRFFVSRDQAFKHLPNGIETVVPDSEPLLRLAGAIS
jgi:predicted nucleic acid-binding protein